MYWVGGSGNWTDYINHWSSTSGGAPDTMNAPTMYDQVYFDSASFATTGQTVTIDDASSCYSMSWLGATNTPTLAGTFTMDIGAGSDIPAEIRGITFIPEMNVTYSGAITLLPPGGINTFEFNTLGKVLSGGITGTNITLRLLSALNLSTGNLILSGTETGIMYFEPQGYTVTCDVFQYSNTGFAPPVVNMGASTFNIRYFSGNNLELNLQTSTWNLSENSNSGSWTLINTTLDAGTSTINVNGTSTFDGNGYTYATVVLSGSIVNIASSNTFSTLTLTAGKTVNFYSASTQTVTTLTATGTSGNLITFRSTTANTHYHINKNDGVTRLNYIDLKDCHAEGRSAFDAGSNSIDSGGNSGWGWGALLFVFLDYPHVYDNADPWTNLSRKFSLDRILTDTSTISESFTKFRILVKVFIENINITETYKSILNGLNTIWSTLSKTAGSWADKVKTVGSWTDTTRITSSWTNTPKTE